MGLLHYQLCNFLPAPRRGGVELCIDRCITNDEGCGVEYSVASLHLKVSMGLIVHDLPMPSNIFQ